MNAYKHSSPTLTKAPSSFITFKIYGVKFILTSSFREQPGDSIIIIDVHSEKITPIFRLIASVNFPFICAKR